MTRSVPLAVALLACSLAVPVHAADPLAPEPGLWWELTSTMSVTGKNVPPEVQQKLQTSTSRECLPKRIPDRPPPNTGDCTLSDYRHTGSRVSFKMSCQSGVTGETELVWTSDTYSGKAVMRGQGMENRISIKGKKLGGDCDANERARERAEARRGLHAPAAAERDGGDAQDAQDAEDAPPDEPVDED